MSAIAGLVRFDGKPGLTASCARMLSAQGVYGPHGGGAWEGDCIALGRRLFHSLPEDAFDRQPVLGAAARFALVADVRLDNREELAAELGIEPPRVARLSDAGLLLAVCERWGDDCFDRLVGDYAFALWDSVERRLLLARDPFGTRPLHFHRGNSFLAFASMAKGLHALPEVPYAPDEDRVAEHIALVPEYGSRTFFQGIERVEPGQCVAFTPGGMTVRDHWRPRRRTIRLSSPAEYAEALRTHLDTAVRARLRRPEGPVGAHLSAGFDSASVAATAAQLLAPGGERVVAFTSVPRAGYDGPPPRGRIPDEGPLAAATAALHPNMEHVLVRTGEQTPLDNLDRDFFLFERPIVNICNQMWLTAVSAAARERKIRVMLTGVAGNLTVSYDGYALLPELIARGRWLRWFAEARALVAAREQRWRGVLAGSFGPWTPRPLWKRLVRSAQNRNLDIAHITAVNMDLYRELRLAERAADHGLDLVVRPRRDSFETKLWAIRRVDFGNYNKGILGGWGIDQRDPTTDRRLVEFCLAVPNEEYLSKGVPRALARRALADRLPREVLQERRRGLQTADWHERLTLARDQLGAEIERLERSPMAARALNLGRMRSLVENWPAGGWERTDVTSAYRLALLRGISNGHFLRKASGGNA